MIRGHYSSAVSYQLSSLEDAAKTVKFESVALLQWIYRCFPVTSEV